MYTVKLSDWGCGRGRGRGLGQLAAVSEVFLVRVTVCVYFVAVSVVGE